MATISARIDDKLKADVEEIADAIGLPLSSVINVLLKKFCANKGFPFDVVATDAMLSKSLFDPDQLQEAVTAAVSSEEYVDPSDSFTYFDSKTNSLITKHT